MNKYELILTIINQGYTDIVMDAAREVGATGGTIIKARGAGKREAEKLFGLTVQPEKEVVMILTETQNKNAIMTAIITAAGLNTKGKGICFSLPVDDVLGTAFKINDKETKDDGEN